jgi:phage anti-repressor protein
MPAEISAMIERATVAQSPSGGDEHGLNEDHGRADGSTQVPTVSARQLHSFLEVGKIFTTWIQERIVSFGFVEGQDFVMIEGLSLPNLGGAKPRAQTTKEYHLSIDMAKELSMVERNEKGKQARRYFIECEKRMVEGTTTSMGRTTSASIGGAVTEDPKGPDASGGRCRKPTEGILERGRHPSGNHRPARHPSQPAAPAGTG